MSVGTKGGGGKRRGPALEAAVRQLARRPLTCRELRDRLRKAGYADEEAEEAVARLREQGYLDDHELAVHFITVRAERKGHGPARLVRELEARGVAAETAARALRSARESGAVDPDRILRREVEKRLGRQGTSPDRKAQARVYNALLRSGFEPQSIRSALEDAAGGFDDDVT
jgi:regulatory protein